MVRVLHNTIFALAQALQVQSKLSLSDLHVLVNFVDNGQKTFLFGTSTWMCDFVDIPASNW